MRKFILAVAALIVIGAAAVLRADDKLSTDDLNKLFERGGASDEFKGQFQLKFIPIRPLEAVAVASKSLPKFGKYVASYTPSIQNSTNYPEMLRQLQDSRMPSLPPAEQEAFRVEGGERTKDRGSLLGRSDKLDNDDETLYWEGQRLNQRAADLNGERDRINVDVARFNKFCTGRSLPPGDYQYCQAERTRIENWKIDLGKRIESHNKEFYAWEDKFGPFYAVANALGQAIQTWEGQMANLIDRLKQALAKIEHCQELESDFKKACGKKIPACNELTGCADLMSDNKLNLACAQAADALNEQCHAGARQDLSERAKEARSAAAVCAAWFSKKCGDWDQEYGRCTKKRHDDLEELAGIACREPYSCQSVNTNECSTLKLYRDNGTVCRDTRQQVMTECYDGGDRSHRNHVFVIQQVIDHCQWRLKNDPECRGSTVFDWR